jgi:hypothetical protein
MAYSDGDDFIDGAILSFQQANRLKNHFRGATAPSNAQEGMIFSGASNDKVWHRIGSSLEWDEILQETMSFDATPMFDNLILDLDSAELSDPPTDAELSGAFGSSMPQGFIGFIQDATSAAKVYLVFSDGTNYFYLEMAQAL